MSGPRIQLEGARERPIRLSDVEVSLPTESVGEPLISLSPIALSGEISAVGEDFLLDAMLSYSGELECSRCLAAYPFTQSHPVRLRLRERPPADAKPGRPGRPAEPEEEEVELSGEDLDIVFFDEGVLPLEEIAREQVLIQLPMKPLCSEDCRGLCAVCGKDLNVESCSCDGKATDPRLEVLKNFK